MGALVAAVTAAVGCGGESRTAKLQTEEALSAQTAAAETAAEETAAEGITESAGITTAVACAGFSAGASVHDPSIIRGEDGRYYIFGSHMSAAVSEDLRKWNSIACGVNGKNPLFENLFEPDFQAFSFVGKNDEGGYSVWAPDVIYNEAMGKYLMYFCTTSSYMKSSLCFGVADELTGPYRYVDTVLYSGFTKGTAKKTNLEEILGEDAEVKDYLLRPSQYNNLEWPNCIDPALFYDEDHRLWMVYGSWSGGIFLLELDEKTGYPIYPVADPDHQVDAYYGKKLLGGMHHSIEGPYILYEEQNGYYYLFVSYGGLAREGGYQIRVFRSRAVDGPYTDAAGQELGTEDHSGYGVKLMGNYLLPGLPKAYMSPGHCSAFKDSDGKRYVVYHTRFDDGTEYHEPRVHQLFLTKNGWPVAAPFAASGETLSDKGYETGDLAGTWYLLDHGLAIDSAVNQGKPMVIDKEGNGSPGFQGTGAAGTGDIPAIFSVEKGTNYVTVTVDGIVYEGVIVDMTDESGNAVHCISAVGENNRCVWVVRYDAA